MQTIRRWFIVKLNNPKIVYKPSLDYLVRFQTIQRLFVNNPGMVYKLSDKLRDDKLPGYKCYHTGGGGVRQVIQKGAN